MTNDLHHLALVDEEEIVLDEAALVLAALDDAEAEPEACMDVLEAIAARLQVVGTEARSAASRAAAMAQVLSTEFGFTGDAETYDDPVNADMLRVVERRRGLPVSLSILYVSAARRVGWRAAPLNVPGHVLVLVGEEASPVIIDPFNGGRPVDRETLVAMLPSGTRGGEHAVRQIATMPNRAVLVRLLLNQATRAEAAGRGGRALTLYRRMTEMAPEYAHAWWERARLELIDGDTEEARRSLGTIPEITRDTALRRRVKETLAALSGR